MKQITLVNLLLNYRSRKTGERILITEIPPEVQIENVIKAVQAWIYKRAKALLQLWQYLGNEDINNPWIKLDSRTP